METPKKRKRGPDPLRVTYDAQTRTFDRLFKEYSLEEMRNVIRKKMSLPHTTKLRLYQIRDGKSIDLEDDDDFEAFAASGSISSTATVRVVIGDITGQPDISKVNDSLATPKIKTKKKKVDKTPKDPNSGSTTLQDAPASVDSLHTAKKRRVSFAEALSSPLATLLQETKKKRRLSMSDLGQSNSSSASPNPASALPSDILHGQTTDDEDDKKRKRKKKKKQHIPVADSLHDIPDDTTTSSKPKSIDHAAGVQLPKKSKKRTRTDVDDSSRGEPIMAQPRVDLRSTLSIVDQESEQPPPKKRKSKQKKGVEDGVPNVPKRATEAPVDTPSSVERSPLDSAPTAEPKKQKRKKEKSQSESRQEHAQRTDDAGVSENNEGLGTTQHEASSTPIVDGSPKQKNKRSKQKEKHSSSQQLSQDIQALSAVPPVLAQSHDISTTEKVRKRKSKKSPEGTTPLDQAPEGNFTSADQSPPASDEEVVAAKPSKKKKKKTDTDPAAAAAESAHKPPTIDVKEATHAAVQAIIARYIGKNMSTNSPAPDAQAAVSDSRTAAIESGQPTNVSDPLAQPTPRNAVSLATSLADQPTQPSATSGSIDAAPESKSDPTISISRKAKPALCPYCDGVPYHYRSKCKLFRAAGAKNLETRIQELEAKSDAHRESIIKELKQEVENKLGRPYKAPEAKTTPVLATSKPPATPSVPNPANPSHKKTTVSQVNGVKEPTPSQTSTPQPAFESNMSSEPDNDGPSPAAPRSTRASEKVSTAKPPKESNQVLTETPNPLNAAFSPFLDVRDISSYTEKDLEALIRGPPVSSRDVPSTETSEDEEEEEGGEDLVDDEDNDVDKPARSRGRPSYVSSSDDDQEEEDDQPSEQVGKVGAPLEPPTLVSEALANGTSESDSNDGSSSPEIFHEGNISFQEMEALGSSLEIDRAGDVAFENAYAKDIASVSGNPILTYDETVNLVPPALSIQETRQFSEESEDSIVEEPTSVQPPASTIAEEEDDPIENEDSDNLHDRVTYTPSTTTLINDTVNLRTRAQKEMANKGIIDSSAQPTVAENTPVGRSGKKKGVLTPISELPIPPHPGVRVIKPPLVGSQAASKTLAKTPGRGRQRVTVVAEESRVEETTPSVRVTRRSSRSIVAGSQAVATPGKRSIIVQPVTEPEEGDGAEVPKTRPRTRLQRATSAQPEATPTNPGSKILNATMRSTSKAAGIKTPAKPPSKAPAASNKKKQVAEQALDLEMEAGLGTPTAGNTNTASWTTLPETQERDSQAMTDTHEMADELLPSSNPFAGSSVHNDDEDVDVNVGSSRNPLFLHSETQQSLPYSQYPDISTKPAESPTESDEEDEVAAVIQTPPAPVSIARYRGLTELQGVKNFSRPTLRPARFDQKPVHDLYGRSGKDSDSSEGSDSTDTEPEGNKIESHIPESRRAGGQTTRRK